MLATRNLMLFIPVSMGRMKGYLNIPKTIYVKRCKDCGARPIIAMSTSEGEYTIKCPISDNHFQTEAGLIDIDAWNRNNRSPSSDNYFLDQLTLI